MKTTGPQFSLSDLAEICRAHYEDEAIGTTSALMLLSLSVLKNTEELIRLRHAISSGAAPIPDPPEAREFYSSSRRRR
jgi:hypothetical protein